MTMRGDIPEIVAYGALCRWWDDKRNVGVRPSGLPCCPHCGGPLYEADGQDWFAAAESYEQTNRSPGYIEHLWASQGMCNRIVDG